MHFSKWWTVLAGYLLGISTGTAAEPACVRQIESTFFNPVYVSQALSSHDVSQSAWSEVNRRLREEAVPQIALRVREQAAAMHPNPFDAPFQPDEASKVLQGVLYDLFAAVLREFNISNPQEIREMFDYIRQQQGGVFAACFPVSKEKGH
jgi:hypothetical protein